MKGTCSGCQNDTFIQNKKHNLCGECVFKKSHGGKSKQEVYNERAIQKTVKKFDIQPLKISPSNPTGEQIEEFKKEWNKYSKTQTKIIDSFNEINEPQQFGVRMEGDKLHSVSIISNSSFHIDEEAQKNIRNQDEAERREKEEQGNVEGFLQQTSKLFEPKWIGSDPKPEVKLIPVNIIPTQSKKKPIKQISSKQSEINRLYKLTCIDMDYTTEPVCTGCLKYQGGDIKLSHSHIISREDCKRIGREDLIYDRDNLTYHCLCWGENGEGCHRKHENPVQRKTLDDYKKNMEYIKSISEELYQKYIK